jgi:hypothetical protein
VINVTEPQVWTMIGVFTALMFGMLTIVSTLFVRVIRSEIGGLRSELDGRIGGLRGEIGGEISGLRGEIEGLRREMTMKFDNLDRDVQVLMRREFGIDRD